jgi:hypothetical protein
MISSPICARCRRRNNRSSFPSLSIAAYVRGGCPRAAIGTTTAPTKPDADEDDGPWIAALVTRHRPAVDDAGPRPQPRLLLSAYPGWLRPPRTSRRRAGLGFTRSTTATGSAFPITSASADRRSGFGHRQSSSASRVTAGAAGLSRPVTVIATPGGVAVRAVSGRLQPPGRHHRIVQTGIGL